MRVLLIEDEPEMAALLAGRLSAGGFIVDCFRTCDEASAALAAAPYDLVVLDRRLPDGDGASLIPQVRARQPGAPVICLTAMDAVRDRVDGFEAGADDYVTKPYDGDELMARIRAHLRRPGAGRQPPVTVGNLSFDLETQAVAVDGTPLSLHRRELACLEALVRRAGRVVTRETLDSQVYGFDDQIQSNALDALVCRLRRRLAGAAAGVAIHTVRGVGYMLAPGEGP